MQPELLRFLSSQLLLTVTRRSRIQHKISEKKPWRRRHGNQNICPVKLKCTSRGHHIIFSYSCKFYCNHYRWPPFFIFCVIIITDSTWWINTVHSTYMHDLHSRYCFRQPPAMYRSVFTLWIIQRYQILSSSGDAASFRLLRILWMLFTDKEKRRDNSSALSPFW